jgi:hypothetical protein
VVEVVVGVVQQQFLAAEASLGVILLLYLKEKIKVRKNPPCVFTRNTYFWSMSGYIGLCRK